MSDPLYDKIASLLADKFGVDQADLSPSATFEDLDLDSLDLVEFAMTIQDELGVELTDDEAAELDTLDDAVKLLASKGASG